MRPGRPGQGSAERIDAVPGVEPFGEIRDGLVNKARKRAAMEADQLIGDPAMRLPFSDRGMRRR